MTHLEGPAPSPGLIQDLDSFIELALECDLDENRFHERLLTGASFDASDKV
jgi:hypothetical protein